MAQFENIYAHGHVRVAAASPLVHLADPDANAREIIELAKQADAQSAAVLVCPELCLSGYSLDDLHMQTSLLSAVEAAIATIQKASRKLSPIILVGAPVRVGDAIFNCAFGIHKGEVLGAVPKSYLPNYREYYERRQFATADHALDDTLVLNGEPVPFGTDLIFQAADHPDFRLGVEICEDLWSPIPPSSRLALAGATVIANLSASNITIGKAAERSLLCASQSSRAMCGYVYAAAGYGESTTDVAWDGQVSIYSQGQVLAESERFAAEATLMFADIDLERIVNDRLRTPTFRDCALSEDVAFEYRSISFNLTPPLDATLPLLRAPDRFPYVPDDPARLDLDCYEAYNIQVQGLQRRLEAAHIRRVVIGVSGGLDSTQALLVAVRAFDLMGRDRKDIIGVTMPGFATTDGTKSNALALMKELGVDAREIDIKPLATQMLADIDHPYSRGKKVYDITFENVQAGLRTDLLFRIANHESGMVVGTGDLSELALGWSTYGVGDHMSHYNVNASLAKTLIQHIIRWSIASDHYSKTAGTILSSILETEISPELVPPGADGAIQSTQDRIGPYNLHDFFLFQTIRYGMTPTKIAFLANAAWSDAKAGHWPANIANPDHVAYDLPEIVKWLEVFVQRFFVTSQFKRSAMPNGPKITSGGSLSPRGDWRAPSDSSAAPWLADLRKLKSQLGLEG